MLYSEFIRTQTESRQENMISPVKSLQVYGTEYGICDIISQSFKQSQGDSGKKA